MSIVMGKKMNQQQTRKSSMSLTQAVKNIAKELYHSDEARVATAKNAVGVSIAGLGQVLRVLKEGVLEANKKSFFSL